MDEHMDWVTLGQECAFLGNTLLTPMRRTEKVGLDPLFWEKFPTLGSDGLNRACLNMRDYVAWLGKNAQDDPVTDVSVEFTSLFIGPPEPKAAPWETMYRGDGANVGFGQATFEMNRLLQDAGLKMSGESNQYADHMGIELLYLSELCGRVSRGECECSEVKRYVSEHPAGWVCVFRDKVHAAAPDGYFDRLLAIESELLALFE